MSIDPEQLKQAFADTFTSDYLRCRACDEKRIASGTTEDICVPHNGPEDLLCPCGSLREAYECQSGVWITRGPKNGDSGHERVRIALKAVEAYLSEAPPQTVLDNVKKALTPDMFRGISAKQAREFKMNDIPAEVPDSAWLSHDGMKSEVTTGAEGQIRIKLAFANPRWIYTTEKTAP
jgi:hypothetical protein